MAAMNEGAAIGNGHIVGVIHEMVGSLETMFRLP
jgi:hypothetical protein